ncbi:unnamed protein product [Rotaria sp. Silwood1]|nr:unnamed protein product [Rotaria sp. Silwood1]
MCEQPSPIDSYNYLPVIQRMTEQISHSHNHGQHSLTNNKKSSSHDSFKYVIPQQEQAYCQAKHAQIVLDESMAINHNLALELNVKEKSQSHNTSHQTKNYSELKANTDFSDMQIIDVRHKLNLIEQDRMQTVQPYVLSVRFKKNYDNDQLLCDIELRTVVTVQTDFTTQDDDTYHRQVPSHRSIDTNTFSSYEKKYSKNLFIDDRHSSVNRIKHRTRHRVRTSSPIHVSEPSNTMDKQSQIDSE